MEKELRKGNYLNDINNRYFKVKRIENNLIESYGNHLYGIDDVKPIPITKELALKICIGISDEHEVLIFRNDKLQIFYDYHFKRLIINDDLVCIENFDLLHRLQNLILDLTESELPINI